MLSSAHGHIIRLFPAACPVRSIGPRIPFRDFAAEVLADGFAQFLLFVPLVIGEPVLGAGRPREKFLLGFALQRQKEAGDRFLKSFSPRVLADSRWRLRKWRWMRGFTLVSDEIRPLF